MDPENTTTDTTAHVAATTDQPASPPATEKPAGYFDQADVNRIVTKRLEEDRARRPAAAPAPKPAAPITAKPAESDLQSQLDEMRRSQTELMQRLDYSSRTAKLGLDDAKAAALFAVYQANPDGFDATVAALGIKATQPAAIPAAPIATQPTDAPKSPAMAPTAPSGHSLPTQAGVVDLFALTAQQRKDLGHSGIRKVLEQLTDIGNSQAGIPQRPRPPSQR
jgi:hypothetical protein